MLPTTTKKRKKMEKSGSEMGTILDEALQRMKSNRDEPMQKYLQNSLQVDAYLVDALNPIETSLKLASVCMQLNDHLSTYLRGYPWNDGGDGPVFGVKISEGIPHLRACCRYGESVDDEWVVVSAILKISTSHSVLAFRCWDMDDGNTLLIEAANYLPQWVDSINPAEFRFGCWVHEGTVKLLRARTDEPSASASPSLARALELLNPASSSPLVETSNSILSAIRERIRPLSSATAERPPGHIRWHLWAQRTALVLPRSVARLFKTLPLLPNRAAQSFAQHTQHHRKHHDAETASIKCDVPFEDLVWSTATISRTSYAMLRSLVSPEWPTADSIPAAYKSAETNRMKRVCLVESTPHVHHALELGLRLTAGLNRLLEEGPSSSPVGSISAEERVLRHWSAIDTACGGDGEWLRVAWAAGPNNSPYALENLLRCPLADIDVLETFPFPLSHPRKTLQGLINQELRRSTKADDAYSFSFPRQEDVDDDEWMRLDKKELKEAKGDSATVGLGAPGENKIAASAKDNGPQGDHEQVSEMLNKFHSFMTSESGLDGVQSSASQEQYYPEPNQGSFSIRPRLFINLLHKTLIHTPEELAQMLAVGEEASDPYFLDEDYDLLVDDESNDAVVVENLLGSLAASGGGPGPVRNMLTEMGLEPPMVDEDDEN